MAGLMERGIEAGASIAGGKALQSIKQGKVKKALMWAIPMVAAGFLVWYIRR